MLHALMSPSLRIMANNLKDSFHKYLLFATCLAWFSVLWLQQWTKYCQPPGAYVSGEVTLKEATGGQEYQALGKVSAKTQMPPTSLSETWEHLKS